MPSQGAMSLGGIMQAESAASLIARQKIDADRANQQPVMRGLAAHIRAAWDDNVSAKDDVEQRMLKSMRQRKGEYEPDKLMSIRSTGGSEIYMMLTAAKCRAVSSWLRDVLVARGTEKPWSITPTPVPDLPPDMMQKISTAADEVMMMAQMSGNPIPPAAMQELVDEQRKEMLAKLKEEAVERTDAIERRMEDQLIEGGFLRALSQFFDDIATFPAAILKGPIIRKRAKLTWVQGAEGWEAQTQEVIVPEWDRVDPFRLYPSPQAETPDDGDLLELHSLSRSDLHAMVGVDGYDERAIRAVLDEHSRGGLVEWTAARSDIEGVSGKSGLDDNPGKLIDALQYWGSVQGKMLLEWGMDEAEVTDPLAEYEVEAWLIGSWVIKAIINPDPLGRRPYYKTSYEELPGSFWGNSPADLVRDSQDMCNAAARALANNMGIASGPQVYVNVDRLPPGEDITNLYPWKIHQVISDPAGGASPPIGFFQPNSNAQELMGIYEKFSVLADEYTGIPRYMTGSAPTGGVGRTASGMSMLMDHAGKVLKQVVANIDGFVMTPLLERLHYYNMRYAKTDDLKGDVRIVARGMNSMMIKESAQVRRDEFLRSTANEFDMQIIGMEGRAEILRESAKTLDMNVDKVVPDPDTVKMRQQAMMMQGAQPAQPEKPDGHALQTGDPVTNNRKPPSNT